MDLISLCALLQTQLNGPFASFLMQSRDNPIRVLGMIACVICSMLVATVMVSTVTFVRNKKSNKILPTRRIIRRRPKHRQWGFKGPGNHGRNFEVKEDPENGENNNCNNNTSCHSLPPPPMLPPSLPPPPPCLPCSSERRWAGATGPVSYSTVVLKPSKRPIKTRENHVNTALVSELKMKFEQRRMGSQYWLVLFIWLCAAVERWCNVECWQMSPRRGVGPGLGVSLRMLRPKGQLLAPWGNPGLHVSVMATYAILLPQASAEMSALTQDRRRTLFLVAP